MAAAADVFGSSYGHHLVVVVELLLLERIVVDQTVFATSQAHLAVGEQLVGIKRSIPDANLVDLTLEVAVVRVVGCLCGEGLPTDTHEDVIG